MTTRFLAYAQFTSSVGDGAFYATSALFFTRVVGLSPTRVELALTVAWAAGLLAGVPLGHTADRFGARRTTVVLALAAAAALAGFLVVRSFPLFVLTAVLYAVAQGGLTAARQALLAGLVDPARRTAVRAALQATANAGLAIGAGLGALALTVDTAAAYRAVFTLDVAAFVAAAVVLRAVPAVPPAGAPAGPGPRLAVLRDRPYAVLTLLNAVLYLNMPLLSLGLPLWIAERTDAPPALSAGLLVLNMLAVAGLQVRVARRVTDRPGAVRAAGRAGWLMLLACAVFAVSGGRLGLVGAAAVLLAAAAIQVLGEMTHGAAAWELGFGLAPADRQGRYQGLFGSGPQIARMLGPVLVTTLLLGVGPAGWLLLGGLFLAAGLLIAPVVRWAERTRPAPRAAALV